MINDLNEAFSALNKCFFQNEMPVNFILNPSEKYVFHLRFPDVIEIGGGFAESSITEILDELLHIMVHLDNYRLGIVDYTSNQYHRREFCEKALTVGLTVVWHKTRGWGLVFSNPDHPQIKSSEKIRQPTASSVEALKKSYKTMMRFYPKINALQNQIRSTTQKPQKVFQLKYICSCNPPVIVRSGRRPDGPNPLDASCNVCGTNFVIEEHQVVD